jgi:hypothetical protein
MRAKAETKKARVVDNLVPEAFKNEGFLVRLNPEPVYYSPTGAGPFVGILLDRVVDPEPDPKYGNERVYFTAVALEDFVNGTLKDGTPQPNVKRGEILRIGEKAQFRQFRKIAGKGLVVAIVAQAKIEIKGGKSCWTFAVYAKPATEAECDFARSSVVGGLDVALLEPAENHPQLTE